jgi:hypothetical protein
MSAPTFVSLEQGAHNLALAGVSAIWFTSAFEVAVGATISEALERFHSDLTAALDSHPPGALNDGEAFKEVITSIMYRMGVAAEWAERVERLERLEQAKGRTP